MSESEKKSISGSNAESRAKLICIDDEKSIQETLKRVLNRDFDVATFSSPRLALDYLSETPDVAVVLTDHRMPEMSGLEVLEQVKQTSPDTIRALLSAQVDIGDMVEAVNSSLLHRFILKPWENEYLRIQMLEALANHSLLREKRMLETLAVTDPVTLLKNHRFFQDQIRIEVDRALRHERAMSLVMIDIDHFKSFNDKFGHPAGDGLLRAVARRLLDQVRSLDTVARYGGEEFAIIMPDTDLNSALLVSERIRTSFTRSPLPGPDGQPAVITLSLGIASVPLHTTRADELVAIADAALYRAKRQGRNQSIGAEPAHR